MGLSQKEYENKIRELVFYFVAAPLVILLGMAITGSLVDGLLNMPRSGWGFSRLFTIIGGVPSLGMYYYKLWLDFKQKAAISQ